MAALRYTRGLRFRILDSQTKGTKSGLELNFIRKLVKVYIYKPQINRNASLAEALTVPPYALSEQHIPMTFREVSSDNR